MKYRKNIIIQRKSGIKISVKTEKIILKILIQSKDPKFWNPSLITSYKINRNKKIIFSRSLITIKDSRFINSYGGV